MRVVIVENDVDVRELIRAAVQTLGWHVETGSSAHEMARSFVRADLLTLDAHLDGENGLKALRAYRRGGGTVPVVVLTADSSAPTRRAAIRAGASAVVLKPFEMVEFLALLEALALQPHDPTPQIIDLTETAADAEQRPWYAT